MKLFAIYIGGSIKGSLIEQHDMRFVVANSIEEAYPTLRNEWWGTPSSLHLDGWAELGQVDGYNISLVTNPVSQPEKLWFVYLGGYDPAQFIELHRNIFLVATSEQEAKERAKAMVSDWEQPHKDSQYDVDAILCVSELDNIYLLLTKAEIIKPLTFTCDYVSIAAEL